MSAAVTDRPQVGDSAAKAWLRALELTSPIVHQPQRILPTVIAELAAKFGETPALISDRECLTYRALADAKSVFVPRPMVLLELADLLRQSNPAEAANLYQQIKKEYAENPSVSERADRGLDLIAPKS